MINGDRVRVLPPFDEAFPGGYVVESMPNAEDGQVVVFLVGHEPAFSPLHLEVIND